MTQRNRLPQSLALTILSALCLTLPASAAPPDHWVGTWGASPLSAANSDFKLVAPDTTLREIVHVSLGGSEVRIILSNEFGLDPLTIASARIALSTGQDGAASTPNALTFGGHASVTIPPGALAVSDPAPFKLPAFADVAVSF